MRADARGKEKERASKRYMVLASAYQKLGHWERATAAVAHGMATAVECGVFRSSFVNIARSGVIVTWLLCFRYHTNMY
jgi:hypothetical protein